MVKVYLASYDPSFQSRDGFYWSWRSEHLDPRVLDRLYYEFASKNRPEDVSRLTTDTIVGGVVRFERDWIFGYRYGNGGRDRQGRPGRFVLVVAALPADQATQCDLTLLLDSSPIRDLLAKARSACPIPRPENLFLCLPAENVENPPADSRADPVEPVKDVVRLEGADAMVQAAKICARFSFDARWSCTIRIGEEDKVAEVVRIGDVVPCADADPLSARVNSDFRRFSSAGRASEQSVMASDEAEPECDLPLLDANRRMYLARYGMNAVQSAMRSAFRTCCRDRLWRSFLAGFALGAVIFLIIGIAIGYTIALKTAPATPF